MKDLKKFCGCYLLLIICVLTLAFLMTKGNTNTGAGAPTTEQIIELETIVPETEIVTTIETQVATTEAKTIDQVAKEVIEGKYGNDPQRSQKLKAEGFNPEEVQKRVNELLPKEKKTTVKKSNSEPKTRYNSGVSLSENEIRDLSALVTLEGGGESYECQKGIASVVINRLKSGYWGSTLNDVMYARGQFTPANRISSTTPYDSCVMAVKDVLNNGTTLPSHILYFSAGDLHSWATFYTQIDQTCFYYTN